MENNNIFIKIVTFTKTNDITLPHDELYFDCTGHEMECIGDYKEGKGSYNELHSQTLLDIHCDKLYTKKVEYEQVEPTMKEITLTFIGLMDEPDENNYQDTGLYKYDEHKYYQLIIGLYEKEETGKYKYIKNSYCNKNENKYLLFNIKIYEPDTTCFDLFCL